MTVTEIRDTEGDISRTELTPNRARITVCRRLPQDIKFRGVFLLLDGEPLANLKFGDSISREVPAGKYKLTATNKLVSQSVEFELATGQTAYFKAANVPFRGLWFFLSALGTMVYGVLLQRVADK